jgi:hypothetical protein
MFDRPKPLGSGANNSAFFAVIFLLFGALRCIDGFSRSPISWSRASLGIIYVVLATFVLIRQRMASSERPSDQQSR